MKLLFILLILIWIGFSHGGTFGQKLISMSRAEIMKNMDEHFKKPCIFVPYTERGILLDGKVSDPAWTEAEPVSFSFLNGTDGVPTQKTEVRLISDSRFLYVGFICSEIDMQGISAFAGERDGALWKDDSVEIFLDVENSGKWPRYFHFGTNTAGTVLDSKWRKTGWNSNVIVRTHTGNECWSAEFAIPFSDMVKDLKNISCVWGANFTRCRQGRLRSKEKKNIPHFTEDTAWRPTGSWDAHEPEDFGCLFLEVAQKTAKGEISPEPFKPEKNHPDPMKACATPLKLTEALEKRFGEPAVFVPSINRSPAVDGRLDEIEWTTAHAFTFRYMDGSEKTPTQKTVGRLLCDSTRLYLGFECFEEFPQGIKADVSRHDGPVWNDDDIEIFLEPAHTHSYRYFQIAVNARGVTFEARNRKDRSWNPDIDVKTAITEDRWTVEMAIPLKDLGLKKGEIPALWGANFIRVRQPGSNAVGEETAWSPTLARISHVPSRFGHIYLESGTKFPDMREQGIVLAHAEKKRPSLIDFQPDVLSPIEQKRLNVRNMTLAHLRSVSQDLWEKSDTRFKQADTVEKWEILKKEIRDAFWKSIGGKPGKKCDLDIRMKPGPRGDGWEIYNVIYQSRPGFWVTGNLYKPVGRKGPFPGVLRVIGHAASGKQSKMVYDMHIELARKGYVSLAIDGLGQGERMICGRGFGEASPTSNHYAQGSRAFLVGANLAGYMVWDGMRGIDYLLSLPEVDDSRIAVTGCSGGGTMSIYLGCIDERISVVVPVSAGGSKHFACNYDAEQNLYARFRDGFDNQAMFALCAPRPLKVITEAAGPLDIPEPSYEAARGIYELYGVPELIQYQKTHHPHGYGPGHRRPAVAWLDRHMGIDPSDIRGSKTKIKPVDLISSKTGMVFYSREFPDQETAVTLQRKKAACSLSFKEKPGNISAVRKHQSSILDRLRELLCTDDITFSELVEKKNVHLRECTAEKVYFRTDPGITVTHTILKPLQTDGPCRTLIWIYERDRKTLIEKRYREIISLLNSGWMICIPNVRGTGESAPQSTYTFRTAETAQNCGGFEVACPLIGLRIKDIRCSVDYLISREDVDRKNIAVFGDSLARINPEQIPHKRQITSPGPEKIWMGQSLGPHIAVMSAALDKRIRGAAVNGILFSYRSLFDEFYFYHQNNLWIPRVLLNFDMGDICAALAPRPFLMIRPVDSLNSRASQKEIDREYRRTVAVYSVHGAKTNIRIDRESGPSAVMEWLEKQFH